MVGVGFIGCGLIAGAHALQLAKVSDATIVSAFDVDRDRSRSFADAHGAKAAGSAAEVIDASDAVYVTTWTAAHPDAVAAVIDAAKPVFCEKPLATDLATASAMVDRVESSGVVNQVGLVLRRSPAFRWLRHQVRSGEIGPAMSMVFRDDQYIPTQGMYGSEWRGDRELAGAGTLLEHSIHDIDLIEWILGRARSVSARTSFHHGIPGIEDQASVLLELRSGAHALLSSTWHDVLSRPSMRRVEIFCRDGYLGLDGDWFGPVRREMRDSEAEEWRGRELVDLARECDGQRSNPDAEFIACVQSGRRATPDISTALRAHVVVDAAYRSAAAGGEVVELSTGQR